MQNTSPMDETTTPTRRRPGRPRKDEAQPQTRAEEVSGRRRRRNSGPYAHGARLGVNEELLDFGKFKYRWVKGTEARLIALTKHDDWDIVTTDGSALKEDSTDLGSAVSVHAGTAENGSSERHFLCRKPKELYEEDQREAQTQLDELMSQLRRGQTPDGEQSDYIRPEQIKL